jgi:superfamily I DNA/RNA helicase
MTPSHYQKAVFDFIQNGNGSAIISAVAGSGKTTTIVAAAKLIPSDKKVLMLAFNKSIADELANRVKLPNIECKTMHSVGFAALRTVKRYVNVDNNKTRKAVDGFVDYYNVKPEEIPGFNTIYRIISLGKNSGIGIITPNCEESWVEICENHAVFQDDDSVDVSTIAKACVEILNHSNNSMGSSIDFDDMIYLPLLANARFGSYDFVFVDEAQDMSSLNRMILKKLLKSDGRLIAVGDPHQAIYGFRGADSESMAKIQSEFNCITLPLSVSYRCAKSIVEEARKSVCHILPSDSAPEGSVTSLGSYSPADFGSKDAIICRNIAPLVSMAYSLINNGVPAVMLGTDIGKGLVTLIGTISGKKKMTVSAFSDKLEKWSSNRIQTLEQKGDEKAISILNDKVECIRIFIKNSNSQNLSDLTSTIEKFFGESKGNCITLCTSHKSKGLEFDKVFILDRSKFNPNWVKMAWMKEQENNIVYVSVTRAKNNLVYIESNSWK